MVVPAFSLPSSHHLLCMDIVGTCAYSGKGKQFLPRGIETNEEQTDKALAGPAIPLERIKPLSLEAGQISAEPETRLLLAVP